MSTPQKSVSPEASHSAAISYSSRFFRLLPAADRADYERLLVDLDHEYRLVSPIELLLVEQMAHRLWLGARAQRSQDACRDQISSGIRDRKKLLFCARQVQHHQQAFSMMAKTSVKMRQGVRVLKRFSPVR